MEDHLSLGNIESRRDWGYAPEYVETMWLMLQQDDPDDYVIATNETHSVAEFVQKAFSIVDLDWEEHTRVDKRFLRPLDVKYLQGNYCKAWEKLRWQPKTRFSRLVEILVDEDVSRWQRWQKGERFAWDAPCYPDENIILSRVLTLDR
jgi:GDPmannose 4,6-dehydratase